MHRSLEHFQQQPLKEERKSECDTIGTIDLNTLSHPSSSSSSLSTPPALDNDQPSKSIMQPFNTINRLPYACRDFRNGHCARGEHCRFIHTLDSRFGN